MTEENIFEHKLFKRLIEGMEKDNLKFILKDDCIELSNKSLKIFEGVVLKDKNYIYSTLEKEYSDIFTYVHYRVKNICDDKTFMANKIIDRLREEGKYIIEKGNNYIINTTDYSMIFDFILVYILIRRRGSYPGALLRKCITTEYVD